MAFVPRFSYTHQIVRNLQTIEAARAVVEVIPVPPDRALALRQAARQRATASSTAIEGNKLNTVAVTRAIALGERKANEQEQEVRNYWRALEWTEEQVERHTDISVDFICELHRIIIIRGRGRRGLRSEWRRSSCPVVNTETREIEYAPPRAEDVPVLMHELVAWLVSSQAKEMPAPLRAAILAHRFVSIHPFDDGNGRTTRALATAELWRSGYDLHGFLSIEEYFAADRAGYYRHLQMGAPVDYYSGRNDPDHTSWLAYMSGIMAEAADDVRTQAQTLYAKTHPTKPVWENLTRRQQQLLMRLLTQGLAQRAVAVSFTPADLQEWYGISRNTAHDWLAEWQRASFVEPIRTGAVRVRQWTLVEQERQLVTRSLEFLLAQHAGRVDKPVHKPTKNA